MDFQFGSHLSFLSFISHFLCSFNPFISFLTSFLYCGLHNFRQTTDYVRMWEILVNKQGWISYVSYVFILLRLCSMREDSLPSFPDAISIVYTTCFT